MTNDTAVYDAMRFDIQAGDHIWTGRAGTPAKPSVVMATALKACLCAIVRTSGSTTAGTLT
jgi:hypothetical protein